MTSEESAALRTATVAEGSGSAVPFNYTAVEYAVEDAAFLAGVVAARLSKSSLGVISGYEGCPECERYVAGFINGARSVEPDIEIETAYLADGEIEGFGDAANAKTFEPALIRPPGSRARCR